MYIVTWTKGGSKLKGDGEDRIAHARATVGKKERTEWTTFPDFLHGLHHWSLTVADPDYWRGRKTIYQPRRRLSQMHTTKDVSYRKMFHIGKQILRPLVPPRL